MRRTRERHVEEPFALRSIATAIHRTGAFVGRSVDHEAGRVHEPHPEARVRATARRRFRAELRFALDWTRIAFHDERPCPSRVGHHGPSLGEKHDRKIESLAAVNGEKPHGVVLFGERRGLALVVGALRARGHPRHEGSRIRLAIRERHELPNVRDLSTTTWQRGKRFLEAQSQSRGTERSSWSNPPEQRGNPLHHVHHGEHAPTVRIVRREKGRAWTLEHGGRHPAQPAPRIGERHQSGVAHRSERATQHGQRGEAVARIDEQREQRGEVQNLARPVKALAREHVGNVGFGERIRHLVEHLVRESQNGAILVARDGATVCERDGTLAGDQRSDHVRRRPSLVATSRGQGEPWSLVSRRAHLTKLGSHPHDARRRRRHASRRLRGQKIFDFRRITELEELAFLLGGRETPLREGVHEGEDFGLATPVHAERKEVRDRLRWLVHDACVDPKLLTRFASCEAHTKLREHRDVCASKSVDRLLAISDHEEPTLAHVGEPHALARSVGRRLGPEKLDDAFLQPRRVLELVHEQDVESTANLDGHVRARLEKVVHFAQDLTKAQASGLASGGNELGLARGKDSAELLGMSGDFVPELVRAIEPLDFRLLFVGRARQRIQEGVQLELVGLGLW